MSIPRQHLAILSPHTTAARDAADTQQARSQVGGPRRAMQIAPSQNTHSPKRRYGRLLGSAGAKATREGAFANAETSHELRWRDCALGRRFPASRTSRPRPCVPMLIALADPAFCIVVLGRPAGCRR